MHVTGIALIPPAEASGNPALTPELLASVLARYSRSNDGLQAILAKVDLADPGASIDRILRFVDYGHASIGGLTGGIAVAMDGVSMWLAYKLFELATMADGQESSTRYLTLDSSALPPAESLGIPEDLADSWREVMNLAFQEYQAAYARLDQAARLDPSLVRAPQGAKPAVVERLRKNYALDRARYLLPFAATTNVALVQSARMWAQAVRHLASLPQTEAHMLADRLRAELNKFAPRLMRHSTAEASHRMRASEELACSLEWASKGVGVSPVPDEVWLQVDSQAAPFMPASGSLGGALSGRANRYGLCGLAARRTRVTVAWNNLAIAELRDLNRHRTGNRWCPLGQIGVYLPPEVDRIACEPFLEKQASLLRRFVERGSPAFVHALLLGSQAPFEHTLLADKFVYEAELRTGMGAHFRYAEHLSAALRIFFEHCPEARSWVVEGTAEPE